LRACKWFLFAHLRACKWFFLLTQEKKWYCTFASFKWFLNIQIGEEKVHIAHLWTHKWFFLFTQNKERKKMISYFSKPMSDFFIHIAHLWSCKWFFQLTQNKKINDIAYLRAHTWFPSKLVSDFFSSHIKRKEMTLHTLVKNCRL